MKDSRCTRCDRLIPEGLFTYESDDGGPVCARCFHEEAAPYARRGASFGFLHVIARLLRFLGLAALAGGAVIAHINYESSRAAALGAAAAGGIVFIALFLLGEVLRLWLSIGERLDLLSRVVQRLSSLIGEGGGKPAWAEKAGEDDAWR